MPLAPETTQLRILKYQEEGEWVAHLLEMDLVGTGPTPEAAEEDLVGACEAQLSYCLQNDINPFHPAPKKFFELWEEAQREELASFVLEKERISLPPQKAKFFETKSRADYRKVTWTSPACP